MDLDDAKTSTRKEREPSVSDLCTVYKFPERKWVSIRLTPGLFSTAGYWVKIKKKDGGMTKFYLSAPSYDPKAQELDSTKVDPWRDYAAYEKQALANIDKNDKKAFEEFRKGQQVQYTQAWFMEAVIRSKQKTLPDRMPKPTAEERKTGFKDKDSDSLTAFEVVRLGKSLLGKIQELKGLNTIERKDGSVQAYAVNHPKFGRDIRVYYDSTKTPADQYQVQLGEKRTPLTEEEMAMLKWDLEAATTARQEDDDSIMENFNSWATRMGIKIAKKKTRKDVDEDEDFDEDEAPKKKKPTRKQVEEDLEDEDDDFDDEDDEDDEPPRKSKKAPAKKSAKSKRPADDEDDEDDDFDDEDDEDDDEDDEPPRKSKKAVAKKSAKSKKPADDEDEDDFDDEEDEDEDEPPRKSKKAPAKKAPAKKKRPADDDEDEDEDDFDDEDEDEDDEDDEPPRKSKKAPAKKSVKKKPADDEDDFDDEDEDEDDDFDDEDDEDDDEDDEPPRKSKKAPAKKAPAKKAVAKKAVKKKRPADDEDDDFDDED